MSKEVIIHYSQIKLLGHAHKSYQQIHLLSRLLTVEAVVSSLDTFVLQYRTFYRSHTHTHTHTQGMIIVFSLTQYMHVPCFLLLASALKAALSSLSSFFLATLSSLSSFVSLQASLSSISLSHFSILPVS